MTLDDAWSELEADVKDAIKRNRAAIEAAARAQLLAVFPDYPFNEGVCYVCGASEMQAGTHADADACAWVKVRALIDSNP